MIEKRVLNKKKVQDIFKKYYGISTKNIQLVSGGSAEIYKVDSYVLKLYQSKYKIEDVRREVDAITFLKEKGMMVPTYLKMLDGKICLEYENRCLIVQEFISGYTKDKFMASEEEIKECGYLHGLLVKNFMDYPTTMVEEEDWYDIPKNIDKLEELLERGKHPLIVSDIKKKIELLKKLDSPSDDINKISHYVSHGDFSYLQFIYDENKVKAIIDFIRVRKLPIVWEIMRSYTYMDQCQNGDISIDHLISYIKEFQKSVSLNSYDLKYMVDVYLYQLLRSTYGYKEYYKNPDESQLEFAHFRTLLCESLYKNREEISRRLEEL